MEYMVMPSVTVTFSFKNVSIISALISRFTSVDAIFHSILSTSVAMQNVYTIPVRPSSAVNTSMDRAGIESNVTQ